MAETKVFDDLDNTVFAIIDAADEKGITRCIVPKQSLQGRSLREVLEDTLDDYRLWTSSSKGWLKAIDGSKVVLDDGHWLVSFNAARFFGLPCEAPAEELAELRELFQMMKPHFVANAQAASPGFIRVLNEHNNHNRVYGSLKCHSSGNDGVDGAELGRQLQAVIDASPVLLHFQRSYALKLGRIGRYSWCDLREENFFASGAQPWREAFARKRAERLQASQAS